MASKLGRPGTASENLDNVDNELKKEQDDLLKIKEVILKEIRLLKAEDVTLQRLIAHMKSSRDSSSSSSEPRLRRIPTRTDDTLPNIDLLLTLPGHRKEEQIEEDDEEEEMDE